MRIDNERIERLVELSHTKSYDVYTRFNWPDSLPVDDLWCNEDLLTTFGTEFHSTLTDQQKFELSKWEAINFYSLNVHGIKAILEFVCSCIYKKRYEGISKYLHFFLAEENAHMWFFANFCQKYGGKIYPNVSFNTNVEIDPIEHDLYMFAGTLIFEEFVDFYNHRVGKNDTVPEIVREINSQHHIDESRHVSFGREVVKGLFQEILDNHSDNSQRERINKTFKGMLIYFIGLMYNAESYSDAGIVQSLGCKSAAEFRNTLRHLPERRDMHHKWFNRTASYFKKIRIIDEIAFLRAA